MIFDTAFIVYAMKSIFTVGTILLLAAGTAKAQLTRGTKFPAIGRHACIDGRSYDFSKIRRPAVLMLGLSSCPHCRSVLHLLMTRADVYARKGVDVVYMTYESPGRVRRDVKKTKIPAGICLIADPHYCIHDARLAAYFPSFYFIDKTGVISRFEVAAKEDKEADLLRRWDAAVQELR